MKKKPTNPFQQAPTAKPKTFAQLAQDAAKKNKPKKK
jgi:hypothetical protein